MGKIRVKTLGDESLEQQEKAKRKEERMAKKAATQKEEKAETVTSETIAATPEVAKTRKKAQNGASKRYKESNQLVNKHTSYPLDKALGILKEFKKAKFDETVELHLNVREKGISGQVTLPHGTGKKITVKVADDALIAQIEKGKIDFDILLASPSLMPKLAKVARVLGPRGLMPNPKAGTVTDKPEEMIQKLTKGQINYKTESKAPIMHVAVGKVSFEENALKENIKTIISAIGISKIKNVTLKSTMSPAVKVDLTKGL